MWTGPVKRDSRSAETTGNDLEQTRLEADYWDELVTLGTPALFNTLLNPADGLVRNLTTKDLRRARIPN